MRNAIISIIHITKNLRLNFFANIALSVLPDLNFSYGISQNFSADKLRKSLQNNLVRSKTFTSFAKQAA